LRAFAARARTRFGEAQCAPQCRAPAPFPPVERRKRAVRLAGDDHRAQGLASNRPRDLGRRPRRMALSWRAHLFGADDNDPAKGGGSSGKPAACLKGQTGLRTITDGSASITVCHLSLWPHTCACCKSSVGGRLRKGIQARGQDQRNRSARTLNSAANEEPVVC